MQSEEKNTTGQSAFSRGLSSVAGKFTLGLITWFVAVIVLIAIGLLYLTAFQSSLFTLTSTTLPNADSSAKLAVATTSLTGKVRRFALVDSQVERRLAIEEIQTDLALIDELIPALENARDFDTFRNLLNAINQSIARLDTHINERIELVERKQVITSTLSNQFSSGFFRVEQTPAEQEIAVLMWQSQISGILIKAIESSSIEKVRDTRLLARRLEADFKAVQESHATLPEALRERLRVKEQVLEEMLFDDDGYLDSLVDGLKISGRVRGLENQVLTLNEEVTKLSAGIFEQAADRTSQDAATVNAGIDTQVAFTLVAGAILLLITIIVATYLRRTLVLRLNKLNGEVQNYGRGEAQSITVTGNDEITDISVSIQNFIREIEDQQTALIDAKSRAEDATKSKSEFLATMSHEIRTPMNGVVSMTAMLAKTELNNQQRELIAIVEQSASSLLTIINDILDFSRIEAGKLDIEETEFDLRELVSGVAALCGADAYQKGLELFYDIDVDVPNYLLGDPTRIRQVLLNLASNAVKFTESGHVQVKVRSQEQGSDIVVSFEVLDTGIGISSEAAKRLFQAFEQVDGSTVRRFGGSGLGLSICKSLIKLMNGTIGVDSEPGQGSKFHFSIPLKVSEAGNNRREASSLGLGTVFVLSSNELTIQTLRSGLNEYTQQIVLLNPEDPSSWPNIIEGHPEDQKNAILLDQALLDGDPIIEQIKDTSALSDLSCFVLAPRSEFGMYENDEWDWLSGLIAKPINKHSLAENIVREAKQTDQAKSETVVEEPISDRKTAEQRKEVILVAEDNIINQKVVARLLEAMGLQFDIVNDGEEALEAMKHDFYGMVLTDFHMPNMDGLMLTKALKSHENQTVRSTPVIMLTADAQTEAEEMCRDAGVQGFLSKPIVVEALSLEIEKWMPNSK